MGWIWRTGWSGKGGRVWRRRLHAALADTTGAGAAAPYAVSSAMEDRISKADVYNSPGWKRMQDRSQSRPVAPPREARGVVIDATAVSAFTEGDRVFHRKFGYGIVIGIAGLLALFLTILFVVKGSIMFPAAAALAWAVLVYIGVDFGFWGKVLDMSNNPERVWRAIQDAKQRKAA